MSALPASAARALPVRPSTSAPASTPSQATGPRLRLVEAPAHERSSTRFVMACIVLLLMSVLGVLLLNTEMANGAYERADLTKVRSQEAIIGEQLSQELADISTAENLSKRAEQLGMRQMVNPDVLHIDSSKVVAAKGAEGN